MNSFKLSKAEIIFLGLLLLFQAYLILHGLKGMPIPNSDDAIYASVVKGVVDGHWYPLYINEFEYNSDKPALFYWLSAVWIYFSGAGEMQFYYILTLISLLTTLVLFSTLKKVTEQLWLVMFGTCLYALSYFNIEYSRSFFNEVPMNFCLMLILRWLVKSQMYRCDALKFGLLLTLGYMIKNVSLVFPFMAIVPPYFLKKYFPELKIAALFKSLLVLFAGIVLWALFEKLCLGDRWYDKVFYTLLRALKEPVSVPPTPWWDYFDQWLKIDPLLFILFGFSVVLSFFKKSFLKNKLEMQMLLWALGGLILLSFVQTRMARYLYPLYPAATLLIVIQLNELAIRHWVIKIGSALILVSAYKNAVVWAKPYGHPYSHKGLREVVRFADRDCDAKVIYLYNEYFSQAMFYSKRRFQELQTDIRVFHQLNKNWYVRENKLAVPASDDLIKAAIDKKQIGCVIARSKEYVQTKALHGLNIRETSGIYVFLSDKPALYQMIKK